MNRSQIYAITEAAPLRICAPTCDVAWRSPGLFFAPLPTSRHNTQLPRSSALVSLCSDSCNVHAELIIDADPASMINTIAHQRIST
eukprot:3772648-Pleurochrysis_carterae.AAC.2